MTELKPKDKVMHLQEMLNKVPQVDCPIKHYFAPGVFAREITIPKGTCLIGAVHKTDNLAILSSGRLLIVVDTGTMEMSAPYVINVKAGQKNAAVALETSTWTNFFPNPENETDIDVFIERFTESKASELIGGADNKQLKSNHITNDREDYKLFLSEYGLSEPIVLLLVHNDNDLININLPKVEKFDSLIEGKGLRALADIKNGESIGLARLSGNRTQLGRFLNHSVEPNVKFTLCENNDLMAYSIKDIKHGEELTNCYRQAMSVNNAGFSPLKGKL
jgi:hypothetical protein